MTATAEPSTGERHRVGLGEFLRAEPEIDPPGRIRRGWLYVHLATLVVAVGVLFYLNRDQWFFYDDWDFISFGTGHSSQTGWWAPHNQHWSTIPLLLYIPLRDLFGVDSYLPFITELICLHIALTHFLWRAMLRAGCTPLLATAAAGMFAVFGAGSDNLLWAFQIGFVGSLTAGWAAALVIDQSGKLCRRDAWAVLLLVISLMCSGVGVPVVVLATLLALARARDIIRPLVVGGIPTAVFAVWFFSVEQPPKPAWTTPADDGVVALGSYVIRGLRDTLTAASDVPSLLAVVVLAVVVIWALFRAVAVAIDRPGAARNAIALAGLIGAAGFFLISGFGRADPSASRYIYVAMAFALPGLTLALSQLARRRWIELLAFLLVASLLVFNLQLLDSRSSEGAAMEATIRESVIATAYLISSSEPVLVREPEPLLSPQVTTDVILELLRDGEMPTGPVDQTALLRMRLALQIRIEEGTGTVTGVNPPTLEQQVDVSGDLGPGPAGAAAGTGCLRPTATGPDPHLLIAAPGGPATLQLSSTTGGQFDLTLAAQGPDAVPRTISVQPGQVWSVGMELPAGTQLRLTVPRTDGQICGLAMSS